MVYVRAQDPSMRHYYVKADLAGKKLPEGNGQLREMLLLVDSATPFMLLLNSSLRSFIKILGNWGLVVAQRGKDCQR